jgi:hypothetical protein
VVVVGRDNERWLMRMGTAHDLLHDPEYTKASFGVETPIGEVRAGQVRRAIIEHTVEAGVIWRRSRLVVAGPMTR